MKINEIESAKTWNDFVDNFGTTELGLPKSSFIQSFEWADFQENIGRKVLKVGLWNSEDKLIGGGIGVEIRAKRGNYIYFRHGPLLNWQNRTEVNTFLNYLKSYCKKNNLWFIRVSPLVEDNSKDAKVLRDFKFPTSPMNDVEALDTWITDLSIGEENLLKKMKKSTRYEIKKANKLKLGVKITDDEKYLRDFWIILEDTVKRQGWNAYSFKYIQNEFKAFANQGKAKLILIEHKGEYISGGIFIKSNNQYYYHYGASLSKFYKIPSSYLMIWEAMKLSISEGIRFFNFWGVSPKNDKSHPWYGLSSFKRKFYGFEQNWLPAKDIKVSNKYFLTNTFERIDKFRKGY